MTNNILISVGDGSTLHPSRTHFLKVTAGFHMGKLHAVDRLARRCFEVHKNNPFKTKQMLQTVEEPEEIEEEDEEEYPTPPDTEMHGPGSRPSSGHHHHRNRHHQDEKQDKTDQCVESLPAKDIDTKKLFKSDELIQSPEKMEKQLSEQGWFYKKRMSVIPDNDSVDNILKELDEVVAQTTPYQTIINIIAPAVQSGVLSVLMLPGSPADALLAFTLAVLTGIIVQAGEFFGAQGSTEIVVAIVVSFLARVTERLWPGNQQFIYPGTKVEGPFATTPVCFFVFSFTSLAQLLPGTQITLGMLDLAQSPSKYDSVFFVQPNLTI
jgi:hypothetical protein